MYGDPTPTPRPVARSKKTIFYLTWPGLLPHTDSHDQHRTHSLRHVPKIARWALRGTVPLMAAYRPTITPLRKRCITLADVVDNAKNLARRIEDCTDPAQLSALNKRARFNLCELIQEAQDAIVVIDNAMKETSK